MRNVAAPNTSSKSVDLHSQTVSGVRDLGKQVCVALGVPPCTAVNETETETTAVRAYRRRGRRGAHRGIAVSCPGHFVA
jgi:hypothetical protein